VRRSAKVAEEAGAEAEPVAEAVPVVEAAQALVAQLAEATPRQERTRRAGAGTSVSNCGVADPAASKIAAQMRAVRKVPNALN